MLSKITKDNFGPRLSVPLRAVRSALFTVAACLSLKAAEISGSVQDRSGARIPAVKIVARCSDTQKEFSATTGGDGTYRLSTIPPGNYQIEFEVPGFVKKQEKSISLAEAAHVNLDEVLDTMTVQTSVDVSASPGLIQTSKVTQSNTLTNSEIVSLPTPSRNISQMVVADAGISAPLPDRTGRGMNLATAPGQQTEDAVQSLNPSVNGARPASNAVQLNGLDLTNMMNSAGGLGNNINVPLDALQEVEVQTAQMSANTGRNVGGNIQMQLRSGANQFHGGAYHYLQNESVNANEFFLNQAGSARPRFRRQETGVNLGGPVFRDKTFFFASVQRTAFESGYATNAIARASFPACLGEVRTRESIAGVANRWLASGSQVPAFRQGLLNAIRAYPANQQPGLLRQFFTDPNTLALRTLTASDIHPVAINILNQKRNGQFLIPSVQPFFQRVAPTASFGEEYLQTLVIPTSFNSWSGLGTLEHNVSDKNRLRLHYVKSQQFIREAFGWADASPSPTLGQTPGWAGQLVDAHVFNGRWVNELRGGFFELNNTRISQNRDITNSSLGIYNPLEFAVGGLAALMPTIDINTSGGNSGGIGNAWDYFNRQRVINIVDNVTYNHGNHLVQFGGEWRRPTIKGEYMARVNGDLDYDNWLLFFTGHGASGGGSDLDQGDTHRHYKMHDFSYFLQDDWRLHPRLTLNLGLRYDFFGPATEAKGLLGNYYLPDAAARLGVQPGYQIAANSPVFNQGFTPLQIGLVVAPGTPLDLSQVHSAKYASTIRADKNNFAPRFGFAWRPLAANNVVIRGGYGIFYDRTSASTLNDLQLSAPFFIYQNVPAPADMANPYPSLNINPFQVPLTVQVRRNANGVPSWVRYDGTPFPATEPFSSKSFTFVNPLMTTPYMQQWSMDLQWEVAKGNLISARYIGTKGTGLLAKLNLAQPRDPRVNPVNGFADIRDRQGNLVNPDFFVAPQFLGLSRTAGFNQRSNWGNSSYNAFQFSFKRRLTNGLLANIAYTFSKSLDNISSDGGQIEHDAFNSRLNRGRSDFDRAHRLTAVFTYQIPGNYDHSIMRVLLKGWNLGGMLTMQSGSPFSILGAPTRNAYFAQVSRVRVSYAPGKTAGDAVKDGPAQSRLLQYFDPTAFADSLDSWGNTSRNLLRGPSQTELDLTLNKRFRITERAYADLRWEVYNVSNTPVFANPASTFATNGYGTAGQITSTIGGPRTMQLAVRATF